MLRGGRLTLLVLAPALALVAPCGPAWSATSGRARAAAPARRALAAVAPGSQEELAASSNAGIEGRRMVVASAAAAALLGYGSGARALVKGNAPPSGYGVGKNTGSQTKCTSVQECEEAGRAAEEAEYGKQAAAGSGTYSKTASGARYKDLKKGSEATGVAAAGDTVRIRYQVMRSGKRSSDGLSGQASTIFSWGYGLEDNEPKNAVLTEKLGEGKFVKALDEGLVGMAVGGTRRVQVRPENGLGWRKSGNCQDVNAGTSAIAVVAGVPGVTVGNEEGCLERDKLPQPKDFGAQRRFSRRFDESLIVEVDLVGIGPG